MKNKVLQVVQSVLATDVDEDTSMQNTPVWDSLKTLQIVMALDEEGLSLPFEKIAEIRSVRDLLSVLEG